jgi:hypothetical protein
MFSKILIKLIDESIVPAILLLATRLISVVLVARANSIPFEIGAGGLMFKSAEDYVLVNSYSTFYMIVALTVGLLYILVKSWFFHDSHIKPQTAATLFNMRGHSLIQNSFNLYSQGSIWLSYSYLLMFVAGLMAIFKFIYGWVFYVALALCAVSTALLILDVEQEIHLLKKSGPEYDNSEDLE